MPQSTQPAGGLEGHAILVTGGGSGIGLGCAERFAADGAAVTICGRGEERLEKAARAVEAVAAPGASVQWTRADVTVEAAVARASEPTGSLDGVVASAGGSAWLGPMTQTPLEIFEKVIAMNITSTFLTIKHAVPRMAGAGGGSIVGVSSIAGHLTHRYFGPYPVGKAGIEALVRNAADEFGPAGVRVNAIRPGLIATEMVAGITRGGPVLEDYLDQTPIRRVGSAKDVAALARFLVGSESVWITGQLIGVDGGHSLRRGPDFTAFAEPTYGKQALMGMRPQSHED